MPDYKAMYYHLAGKLADAVELLQAAQKYCEQMYMEADPPPVRMWGGDTLAERLKSGSPGDIVHVAHGVNTCKDLELVLSTINELAASGQINCDTSTMLQNLFVSIPNINQR